MIDHKAIAQALADGLNGIAQAARTATPPTAAPDIERWSREMGEASKHVLAAFGLDPKLFDNPSIPCGGGWYVERSTPDAPWTPIQK